MQFVVIGCRPDLRRLAFSAPSLWFKTVFGPICGAQYRLHGPGANLKWAAQALHRTPTMPYPVLAYEAVVLVMCKLLQSLGIQAFSTVGI